MARQIKFEGKVHNFPDNATDEEIEQALSGAAPSLQTEQQKNPVMETIGNIPSSAVNMAEGIYQAVRHPIQTGMGLWDAAAGGLQNIIVPESMKSQEESFLYSPRAEKVAGAVGEFYKSRYGGLRETGETIKTDPVGFMADVSTLLSLGAGGLRSVAPQAAKPVSNAAKYTNPLYLAGKGVTFVAKPAYTWTTGMTTSAGSKAIEQAIKGGENFKSAMRGKLPEEQVLKEATGALDDIRETRRAAYQSKLANLKQANQKIDISDIKASADKWLDRFNVKKKPTGELDFSRSTATGTSAKEIEDVYNMVKEWGGKPGDNTPAMLDVLKRRIGEYYATNRNSRSMVSALEKSVKDKIVSSVPEYADMTKEYAKSSEVINDIERAFSLKDTPKGRVAADTALRKLITSIREDNTFRKALLESMDKATGQDVTGAAAGLLFKSPWSHRLGPMFTTLGGGLAALASPKLAALIPLSSPRLVGELSTLMGQIGRTAPYGRGAGITAYQAGRLPLQQEQE